MRLNIGAFGGSWTDAAQDALSKDKSAETLEDIWQKAAGTMSNGQTVSTELQQSAASIAGELAKESDAVQDLAQTHGEAVGHAAAEDIWQKAKPFAIVGLGLVGVVALAMVFRKKR